MDQPLKISDLRSAESSTHTHTGVLQKAYDWKEADMVRAAGLYPYFRPIQATSGADVHIDGQKKIMIGSNNYLGLTIHPAVIEAAKQAIDQYGTGCTGSRFLNGTLDIHLKLEADIAHFTGKEDALVITTGFQTNLAAISCLADRHDLIFSDEENHASIVEACRLSFGRMVKYTHNDMHDLERLLKRYATVPGKLIITDGVFSMSGDIAPLPDLCGLAKRYGATLLIDDAHGVGYMGPHGEGTAHHFGCQDDVDVITGTFSKSFASVGGYVVAKTKVIDWIRHKGRAYIFSASLPPASVATVATCLKVIREEPQRIKSLWKNTHYITRKFKEQKVPILNDKTPIVPIAIGEDMLTFKFNHALYEAGVFANPVVAPAAPRGHGMIRTSYMATHTREELDTVVKVFKGLFEKFNLPLRQANT